MFTINSCSQQNEDNTDVESNIYGTWQLIEQTTNNIDGSPNDWEQVRNGYKITFNRDFSYESEIYPSNCNEVSSSVYNLINEPDGNLLEITISCVNPNTTFESKDFYSIEGSTFLIRSPIEPPCPEGCAFKFKKIE